MCGRYEIGPTPKIKEILEDLRNRKRSYEFKNGEIFPGDTAPVIALNKDFKPEVYLMKWGYGLNESLIFNARSETAADKKMFSEDLNKHRCLVLANYYYEWDKNRKKYKIYSDDEVIYFAGIFRIENNKLVYTILTRNASDYVSSVHHRMPVILDDKTKDKWLNLSINAKDIFAHAKLDMRYEEVEKED